MNDDGQRGGEGGKTSPSVIIVSVKVENCTQIATAQVPTHTSQSRDKYGANRDWGRGKTVET